MCDNLIEFSLDKGRTYSRIYVVENFPKTTVDLQDKNKKISKKNRYFTRIFMKQNIKNGTCRELI